MKINGHIGQAAYRNVKRERKSGIDKGLEERRNKKTGAKLFAPVILFIDSALGNPSQPAR